MQINLEQLENQLKKALSPLYVISGDEPLLVQEARDAIVAAAKSHGFSEKEMLDVDSGFSLEALALSIQNHSLFSVKKILDIRNPKAKLDAAFIAFLNDLLKNSPDDRIIIISTDKLSAAQQKSAWFDAIKSQAIYLPVWPVELNALPQWIFERTKKFNLTFSTDTANFLAHFSEGNLLSTQQAIEKLAMLYPNANVTREQLISVLSDHARFDIFDLSELVLTTNVKKITRILQKLEQTGEEPTLVLWAICRKLREKNALKALQTAANIDEMIKGAKPGNVWQALQQLCVLAS